MKGGTNAQVLVGNGTLKVQGSGTDASTFTANSTSDVTLNIKGSGATTVTKSADGEITISSTDHTYTVNNGTLSIQGNGTTASSFTANQSGNTTLNIKGSGATTVTKSADGEITISSTDTNTWPTYTSQLTNNSGFITSSGSCNYANSAGSAPTNAWTALWTGVKSTSTTAQLSRAINTSTDREIMIVAYNTNGNVDGHRTTIMPTNSFDPNTSEPGLGTWNDIGVNTGDGLSQSYLITVKFSTTSSFILSRVVNSALLGIYVR